MDMNRSLPTSIFIVLLPLVTLLTSCATIMGDENQLVQISSTPTGANVTVKDEIGTVVFDGKTPTSVTLAKSTGKYWGGKDYDATISLAGYQSQTVHLQHKANGWYLAGNLIFGGLIGWFVVDPLNGKMYKLTPEAVNTTLASDTTSKNIYTPDAIRVSLISEVPQVLLSKMIEIK